MSRCFLAGMCALVMLTQSRADDAIARAIDDVVRKQGITADGPGVAILVSQPGRFKFEKGCGLARLKDRTPITPQTMFELASLTKPFTAIAILRLQERGKLSVRDDVRKYIPELPEYAKDRPIHVADLLHHVSGLPDYMRFENVPARYKSYWVNEDYAGQFATQRAKFPLDFPTGEKHIYNNTNYMLLGLVLERVAKKSFGTVIREEVFGPAGMKNSFVYESPKAVPAPAAEFPRAVGYEKQDNGSWKAGWGCPPNRDEDFLTVGDGGVWTNLDDMAAWDAALRAGKLLKAETMKLALTPSKTRDGKTNQYGFGWVLYPGQAGGMNGYGHDGEWRGFRTSYYRYLVTNRSTVVLSNRGDFDTDKFWYALNETVEKALKKK